MRKKSKNKGKKNKTLEIKNNKVEEVGKKTRINKNRREGKTEV